MSVWKKARDQGLSLKATSIFMLVLTLVITAMLIVASFRTFYSFRVMEQATEDFMLMQDATAELMNASDYLTEEAQCFTVIGDRKHVENYFNEADTVRRREHAIATMEERLPNSPALEKLLQGMAESVALMDREYYAMRLMMDAAGDSDLPSALARVTLSEEDQALSPADKAELARRMMHDDEYYVRKNRIRENMGSCVAELKTSVHGEQQEMEVSTRHKMYVLCGLILLQTAAVLLMIWLTTNLGVNPVLRAVEHIKKDQTMPIVGASEFRYLAGTYNTMYNAYKKSIENLNFKASHDELTSVYNRAGYDLIKTSLDLSSTALLLFDADQFKNVNDQYGHETGDRVLQKIAQTLKNNFRSDDYVCRIGGDEFVVFMVHITRDPKILISHKVAQINQDLQNTEDGLPPVSLSAGISMGVPEITPTEMFRQADISLYYVKDHGRDGCCFYSEALKDKKKPMTL